MSDSNDELFEHKTKKEFNFFLAVLPLIVMVISMLYAIVVLETDPHLPLIIGTATGMIVAIIVGFKWDDLEQMMYKGIRLALPAVVIIMLVGLIIGSWIGGGVVATMIYYGLMIISPQYFLVTIIIICAIVSLAIGSSWSTMATIGVAGMGIGMSMGINPAMIAGAVISGSYFGDKMSPLSDTTNLASGLTNTDLFVHIRHMLYTTVPGLIVALIVFFIIGINVIGSGTASPEDIQAMMTSMNENFVISPWLLLVPALVILCIIFKVQAVPALVIGVVLGFICNILIQGDSLADAASILMNGYVLESNNEMVDTLFNRGGLMDMMYTVSLTIVAMTFAGVLEYTGMLKAIMQQILKVAKGTFGIITATIASCFATNVTCSEQYISIVVPSRMYLRTFIEHNLHSKNLSRSLEDGGTLTSVFIPWNTCGVFIYGTLGVAAWEYAPFAILNFTVPVVAIILAATGFGITKISDKERDAYLAKHYPEETKTAEV
ncbi:Na+/H+ antiporter NhaC [Salinicoccus sp. YB14-2]|uniref:Na+/H+ antiporter NhaC n=1 Tax=Salinicoccus sp. YB14-2 TaxID=1572701 RepID=UPI0006892EA6|nr:Na+/H+ antiporter NhaC [Salinicoccus sp. YB14-2]